VSQSNLEILRRLYELFNARDLDGALEVIAADAEFRFIVWGPDTRRTYRGQEEMREFWQGEVFSVFPDFRMEPEDMIGKGDRVVATIHNTGRGTRSGVEVDLRTAVVADFRDSKLTRLEVFKTRTDALKAAGYASS
jgi:ketosteroid isomerase-like protein